MQIAKDVLLVFLFLCTVKSLLADEFDNFERRYTKKYQTKVERNFRRSVYFDNLKMIKEHNQRYKQNLESYFLKENKFSDLTYEEIMIRTHGRVKILKNLVPNLSRRTPIIRKKSVPRRIDWRRRGLVTRVKDQGTCGLEKNCSVKLNIFENNLRACWAFSVIGVVEAQIKKRLGFLVDLSPQQLIDCNYDLTHGNWGCDGGFEEPAFNYIEKYGIMNETDYKYKEGRFDDCKHNVTKGFKTMPYEIIPVSESQLQMAVATVGPISVAIHIDRKFEFYRSGIYSNNNCKKDYYSLNHAVLVVGYGKDRRTGYDYWIVKNSWGTDWGEKGYIRMRRNYNNMCGIATNGLYASLNL